ncbi:MAG: LysR family transcriptional regulator [Actinobacteria bacterium]|nr:MAG: LysR family transcriptional regulator [Actinomycetota bacterium]
MAAKQVVRDAEQTLSRAAARSSLVRVYVATSIGHSRPPGSVRLDSVQTCTYTVVPGKRSEALITSVSTTIDLRHLRYFLAVSEELHFGRAARRLHLTQPPLSHAIRRLEEELGVRLLDRTSRSVALTDAGRVFADEGRKMLAAFQRAVEEARRAGGVGTTVRIGCVPALPIERLLAYIEALRDREPDVSIRVAHLLTLEQEKRLRAGELDLAIVFDSGAAPDLEKQPLFAGEPLAAYLRFDHRLAANRVIGPDDVGEETLVTGPSSTNPAVYDDTLSRFSDAGYRFQNIVEAGGATWPDLLVAVASGQGIALAPASLHGRGEAGGMVVRRELSAPLQMPATFIAWRPDAALGLRGFFEAAQDVARALWVSSRAAETGSG